MREQDLLLHALLPQALLHALLHALLLQDFVSLALELLPLHAFVLCGAVRFVLLVVFFDCELVDMFHLRKF